MTQNKASSRNRLAGLAFEQHIIDQFKQLTLFPELGRTAELDPKLDALGIDLVVIDNSEAEKFKYKIQCKNTTKSIDYPRLLERINAQGKDIAVLFNRRTERQKSERYVAKGEYAILHAADFIKIIDNLRKFEDGFHEMSCYFDSIHPSEQPKLHERLKKLGL